MGNVKKLLEALREAEYKSLREMPYFKSLVKNWQKYGVNIEVSDDKSESGIWTSGRVDVKINGIDMGEWYLDSHGALCRVGLPLMIEHDGIMWRGIGSYNPETKELFWFHDDSAEYSHADLLDFLDKLGLDHVDWKSPKKLYNGISSSEVDKLYKSLAKNPDYEPYTGEISVHAIRKAIEKNGVIILASPTYQDDFIFYFRKKSPYGWTDYYEVNCTNGETRVWDRSIDEIKDAFKSAGKR